jgi:DNA-binding transcriptional regulator YiaG
MTRKVIELFGSREGARRSARVRNTAEATGRATQDDHGREPGQDEGCTETKAGALARMVLDHREGLGLSQREFARSLESAAPYSRS